MDVDGAPDRLRTLPSWLLGQLNTKARSAVSQVFAAHDLQRSHYALLAALEQFGAQSQAQLGERSGLDRSDVARWVDELSRRRLLTRAPDAADRRRNVVSISAAGRRLVARLDFEIAAAQQEFLAALTRDERQQLVALLAKALGADSDRAVPVITDRQWH
jgi:MarR family transcriptional regulator, lower aerobic nicotinate degradation pathway regulator